jgi:hypothetical protein
MIWFLPVLELFLLRRDATFDAVAVAHFLVTIAGVVNSTQPTAPRHI